VSARSDGDAPRASAPRVVKPGFVLDVARVVRAIPRGRVATYGDVAGALGARSVARHVGFALSALKDGTDVPWHRVVNARGQVSARSDGVSDEVQVLRLAEEGVLLHARGVIVDFARVRVSELRVVQDDV
jgi:methylated-DNA-protein-cysteine methyltransferase-like protein